MHTVRFRIRSTQVDAFGHLNNAAYLELYEWARWEWAAAAGMDLQRLTEVQKLGPAIIRIDLRFHKELRAHEEIDVRTWFASLEGLRGIMAQEMRKLDGTLASRAEVEFVMFSTESRRVVEFPEEMVTLFERDAPARAEARLAHGKALG